MRIQKLDNTCSMVHLNAIVENTFNGDWRDRFSKLGAKKKVMFVTNWNFFERLWYLPLSSRCVFTYIGHRNKLAHLCIIDVRTPLQQIAAFLNGSY